MEVSEGQGPSRKEEVYGTHKTAGRHRGLSLVGWGRYASRETHTYGRLIQPVAMDAKHQGQGSGPLSVKQPELALGADQSTPTAHPEEKGLFSRI